MKIQQMFLTPNKYSRPQIKLEKVKKIAVHYVGNAGSSAIANRNYFEKLKDQRPDKTGKWCTNKDGSYQLYKGKKVEIRWVSSHLLVGLEGEIIQNIPFDEWSYCTNQANGYSISIEVCHPDSTGKFNAVTETVLVELVAYLCKMFNLDPEKDVIRHYDVTGKRCPLWYVTHPEAWASFKARVKAEVGGVSDKDKQGDGSFRVRILDPELNIRAQPALTAKINGVIKDKGIYTIVATQHSGNITWGKLKSGAGWISLGSKYVKRV